MIVSKKYRYYPRGSIIYANFTPQKGHELKDPHFAVVLTKRDNPFNSLLTVLPLSSKKHPGYLSLGKCLLESVEMTLNSIYKETAEKMKKTTVLQEEIAAKLSPLLPSGLVSGDTFSLQLDSSIIAKINEYQVAMDDIRTQLSWLEEKKSKLDKERERITKLNIESFGIINQITSIDKARIIFGSSIAKILDGTTVSKETLAKIDRSIQANLTDLT